MYLDPGSGSLILQVILASLLAVTVFFRVFRQKIKALFNRGEAADAAADPEKNDE